jgi:hypothetical protein
MMEVYLKDGKMEFPPDHVGRRTYVTVQGYSYSVPVIYCYMGSDRRYHVIGETVETETGPMIIRDIQPYRSPIDGTMITSRSYHEAHKRQHGVVEVGNEYPKPRAERPAPRAGYDIKRALGAL